MTPATCVACAAPLEGARCRACGAAAAAGPFVVDGVLATTPRGRTYRAHAADGTRVALKEFTYATPPSPAELAAFAREGAMLRALALPSVPRFVACFHEGSGAEVRAYLAQELIEGCSLAEKLTRHRFTEAEALAVARGVLPTLAHLESRRPPIVHRDVKPGNILERPDGSLALVDFGAARHVEEGGTSRATVTGTFGYLPPEQLAGLVGPTTDAYALGATLLHLLTRRPPVDLWVPGRGLDVRAALRASPRTQAFLERLVALEIEDRFPSAAAALAALDEPPWRSRARRYARRGVVVAAGLGLVSPLAAAWRVGREAKTSGLGAIRGAAPDGAAAHADARVPAPAGSARPAWRRFPLQWRFPGIGVTRALAAAPWCERYADLVVEDIYTSGASPLGPGYRVLVDATFLTRVAVAPGAPCEPRGYVKLAPPRARDVPEEGAPRSARFAAGARLLTEFEVRGVSVARLGFGADEPLAGVAGGQAEPGTVLAVRLDEPKVVLEKVSRRDAPRARAVVDLSAEWAARDEDPALYGLRRVARSLLASGAIPAARAELARDVCARLADEVARGTATPPDVELVNGACRP